MARTKGTDHVCPRLSGGECDTCPPQQEVERLISSSSTLPRTRKGKMAEASASASAPVVPSPLNPDAATARARRPAAPREQREKKESLKKREAKGADGLRDGTPDSQSHGRKSKKQLESESSIVSPMRYSIPAPKPADFDPPQAPVLTPTITVNEVQFHESSEHVYNRKGYRYTHCIADPDFPASRHYRQTETAPYGPRFDFEDSSSHILFDQSATIITTEKGWRMARANVGVREGTWYYEVKIVNGVKPPNPDGPSVGPNEWGHVRMGFARREASLESPVGFDAYGYGIRDLKGEKVHMSRPKDFMPKGECVYEGDVLGLEIHLPSLVLHKKVVEGSYNKAVDVSDDLEPLNAEALDIIRDRIPIRYKGDLYFESFEYHATKELEELMSPAPIVTATSATTTAAPHPNHPQVALRTLPFSYIKVYKNGQYMGTPFTELLAFLPPASKPSTQPGANQPGAREGLDDGMVGYFPAVSVFRSGAAEVNFGPDFWFPPPELQKPEASSTDKDDVHMIGDEAPKTAYKGILEPKDPNRIKPMEERYNEQIAEDIVYDILDEVDFLMQDGGVPQAITEPSDIANPNPVAADPVADGLVAESGVMEGGEIKEIVQEEE